MHGKLVGVVGISVFCSCRPFDLCQRSVQHSTCRWIARKCLRAFMCQINELKQVKLLLLRRLMKKQCLHQRLNLQHLLHPLHMLGADLEV